MANKMIDEQTLIRWVVGLLTTFAASSVWLIKNKFASVEKDVSKLQDAIKEASDDRHSILLEIRNVSSEVKHLRTDHKEMKEDNKERMQQTAAYIQQEIITMQSLAENMAIMRNTLDGLEKRSNG